MKTETLFSKLKEKGFVFSTCLQWTPTDIDMRLKAIGQGDQIKFISNDDKVFLLEDFFDKYEDDIIEYINIKLEDHLESLNHYQPSQEQF